jgi:hypothetical protein
MPNKNVIHVTLNKKNILKIKFFFLKKNIQEKQGGFEGWLPRHLWGGGGLRATQSWGWALLHPCLRATPFPRASSNPNFYFYFFKIIFSIFNILICFY